MEPADPDTFGAAMTVLSKKPTLDQAKASDPNRTIWVSANAGSGKTHVLVNRVIRLILAGAEPQEILCLTFTKAAAAEMQNRLFSVLSGWALLDDATLRAQLQLLDIYVERDTLIEARQLFTRTLETPGGLKIQTIHAFAEKLLQLFPVEAGLTPGFSVLDDRQTADHLQDAREQVLAAAAHHPDSDTALSLAMVETYAAEEKFDALTSAIVKRRKDPAQLGTRGDIIAMVASALQLNTQDNSASLTHQIATLDLSEYESFAADFSSAKPHHGFHLATALQQVVEADDGRAREVALKDLYFTGEGKNKRSANRFCSDSTAKNNLNGMTWLKTEFDRVATLFILRDEHIRAEATGSLLHLSDLVQQHYEQAKRQAGVLDYGDLIARARMLLTTRDMAQWVLRKLDKDITHVLVDEAQDTSPEQWDIVLAIAQEFFSGAGQVRRSAVTTRTLFVVGDPKQSIFSFQGADAMEFLRTKASVEALVKGAGEQKPGVSLLTSFRSVPEVLNFVDAVFKDDTAYRAMGFEPNPEEQRMHSSNRKDQHGLVEIWPVIESEDSPEPEAWTAPVDQQSDGAHRIVMARAIAQRIRDWLANKRIIASLGRPVEAGDILILVRKRQGIFSRLIAELRSAGVPVAGADKLSLLESLAVIDLLAIGQCVLLPEDDYALACILKSPFVPHSMTDAMIEEIAWNRGQELLFSRLGASQDDQCQRNHAAVLAWRETAQALGPYAFFAGIVGRSRRAMLTRLGPEAKDATDAFLDLALDYEQERGVSLAGFLTWFASGEAMVKREMGAASNEVRLMTVHGAKGLEAPIVIIPDAADPMKRDSSGIVETENGVPIWTLSGLTESQKIDSLKDKAKELDLQEHMRLLYVALTRARDELYIGGSIDTLVTDKGKSRLSDESWYGFINAQLAKQHDLPLQIDADGTRWFGARDGEDRSEPKIDAPELRMPLWLRTPVLAPVPVRRRGFTALAQDQTVKPAASAEGMAFGSAVHDFLAHVSAGMDADAVPAAALRAGLDAGIAQRFYQRTQMPDLVPFFRPGSLAEVDIVSKLPSGEVISGRIDRFRVTDDAFYLIDYKTDAVPPETLSPDVPAVRQIALYAQSVSENYEGLAAHVALLWTSSGRLDLLPEDLLTRARERALGSVT
jgi:ATP-dependent helicase/nuclease subunit A